MQKPCIKCGEEKPLSDFPPRATALDGVRNECRACANALLRQHRKLHPEPPEERRARLRAWRDRKLAEDPEGFRRKGADYQRARMEIPENRDKKRAADREWSRKNRAQVTSRQRDYWALPENRERKRAHARAYLSKPATKERQRAYWSRPENAERRRNYVRIWQAQRRALLADQFVENVDPEILFDRDGGVCGICGSAIDRDDFHVDHVIPISRGGEHSYANTQVAHPSCNLSKGARLPEELAA